MPLAFCLLPRLNRQFKLRTAYPLADLRNSDFIVCFSGEPDLAKKAAAIPQAILSRKDVK